MANGTFTPIFIPRATGPVKWCPVCGRKHKAREACDLEPVLRVAKSGKLVTRYANKQPRPEPRKKSKARKS